MPTLAEMSDEEFEDWMDNLEQAGNKTIQELEQEIEQLNQQDDLTSEEEEQKKALEWEKKGRIPEEEREEGESERSPPVIEMDEESEVRAGSGQRGLRNLWLNHFVSSELSLLVTELIFLIIGLTVNSWFLIGALTSEFLFVLGQFLREKRIPSESSLVKTSVVLTQALIPTSFYFVLAGFVKNSFWRLRIGLFCLAAYLSMGLIAHFLDLLFKGLGKISLGKLNKLFSTRSTPKVRARFRDEHEGKPRARYN